MDPSAWHTVRFDGCPAGEYAPTWAQRQTWGQVAAMRQTPEVMNVPLAVEIDDRPDLATVLAALRTIVERHDALRTHYRPDDDGTPRQVVVASGELAVGVHEAGAEAQLPGHTERVVLELTGEPFGPADLPLRAAVVTVEGVPRRLALAFYHMSVDGWGSGVVYDELRMTIDRAAGQSMPPLSATPWQPRDQVAYETSERGRRRSRRAIGYWRGQLRRFPDTQLPARPATEAPRFREGLFESRAVAAAAYLLAARTGVSTAAVVLAAYAIVIAHRTRRRSAFLTLLAPNRVESRLQTAVGNYYQHLPICVDVADATFEELAGRALVATIVGYRNGQYDATQLDELLREVHAERGGDVDMSFLINLHLQVQSTYGQHRDNAVVAREPLPVAAGEVAALRRHTTFTWRSSAESMPFGLYLAVWAIADTGTLSLWGDTALLPAADQRAVLEDIERLLVEAVGHDQITTDKLADLALAPPA